MHHGLFALQLMQTKRESDVKIECDDIDQLTGVRESRENFVQFVR